MSTHVQKQRLQGFPSLQLCAAAALAGTACLPGSELAGESELDPLAAALDDVDRSPVTPAGDQWQSCHTWDCNGNHPMLNLFPVPELHEAGLPNSDGMRLLGFSKNGKELRLDVVDGAILGYDKDTDVLEVFAEGAVGSMLEVGNSEGTWNIVVQAVGRMSYWAGGGAVPVYRLAYPDPAVEASGLVNLCKEPSEAENDPMWQGGFETYALLIADERYDRDGLRVSGEDAEGWFNIACAGTTLAKMVLMHYDPKIPEGHLYHTTQNERTALIKMLTGDYLGIGEPFTRPGVELPREDARGWHQVANPGLPEAVWNHKRAVCLDTPRLALVEDGDPKILDKIALACDQTPYCTMPQPCSKKGITDENWTQYGFFRTFNP